MEFSALEARILEKQFEVWISNFIKGIKPN